MTKRMSRYKCVKCRKLFEAMHFAEYRAATGRTIEHCGEVAYWIGEVRNKDGERGVGESA